MSATLVVMAAGMGSRFGGLKQMEPIGPNGEALLDYSVYDAKRAGFDKVVFIIKKAIADDFIRLVGSRIAESVEVAYVYQETDMLPEGYTCPEGREKPWGTGHAVLCCKDEIKTPFAVINADDFYGRSAYEHIIKGISENKWCMTGYLLKNTVTENGHVSRGVCKTENGNLAGVTETTKIYSDCRAEQEDGSLVQLSPDTVVSMNLWGFTPDIFGYLEAEFKKFLEKCGSELKSEFYLPGVVDTLIASGEKQVKVFVADEKWYGVTYKEDKASVADAIARLTAEGKYN